MGYVFARVVGYVSRFSHVQTLRVSCTVTVRFIEVGGYVIWHLHKTVLPTLLKKWGPGKIRILCVIGRVAWTSNIVQQYIVPSVAKLAKESS